jgi:hypothetical protein
VVRMSWIHSHYRTLHIAYLKARVHWQCLVAKLSAKVTTVLALVILGDVTQIGLFLFFVVPPKGDKASARVSLTDLYI